MWSAVFVLAVAFASKAVFGFADQTLPKLELQDVNFVHTSDIHSWYRGHHKADDVSGYWDANIGDVASFVFHMKNKAEQRGQDLFFINSGDDTHGGGLSDASDPEGGKALAIHASLPYDVMTPGNHELETRSIARNLYYNVTSKLTGVDEYKFLASNVFFKDDLDEEVRIAEPYRIWTTRNGKGRKVAALGVSFEDDKTAAAGVRTQPIADMVKEDWFVHDVLESDPDLFLLVGHMSLSDKGDKWDVLRAAIRKKHPTTPIFMFGGHTHNCDCRMDFDPVGHARSIALESGRYLETVGWVSATLTEPSKPLKFVRRYLDPSRETFMRHSGADKMSFDTEVGKEVMRKFDELAVRMGLDEFYGCAPQTYHWDHEKYSKNAKDHVLNFYMNQIFPDVVNVRDDATGEKRPYFVLLNNGFMRGPIYKGEFTKNDKYVNTPYKQRFSYIRLPRLIVERVFEMLDSLQGAEDVVTDFSTAYASAGRRTNLKLKHSEDAQVTLGRYLRNELFRRFTLTSPGYVTKDRCEQQLGPGDDIIHTPPGLRIQFPPTYVHSRSPSTQTLDKYDLVDLVVIQRLEDRVRTVANAAIAMHNAFCEEKWRLCKPIAIVERGAWKGYGAVDSSDAVRDYAKKWWQAPEATSSQSRC